MLLKKGELFKKDVPDSSGSKYPQSKIDVLRSCSSRKGIGEIYL
jgi:hypothetical protein